MREVRAREAAHPAGGRAEGRYPLLRKPGEALAHTGGNGEMESVTQFSPSVLGQPPPPLKDPQALLGVLGRTHLAQGQSYSPLNQCPSVPREPLATLGAKVLVQGA